MKKIVIALLLGMCLAIGLAIAFVSCSSGPFVYDKSVPAAESSILILVNCSVINFDKAIGFYYDFDLDLWAHDTLTPKYIIIPAGTHKFGIYAEYQNPGSFGKKIESQFDHKSYEFLPGHTYAIQKYNLKFDEGVRFTDVTELLNEFVQPSGGSDASFLEGKWVSDDGKEGYIFTENQYVTFSNGKYSMRGLYTIDNDRVYTTGVVYYKKGKWNICNSLIPYTLYFNKTKTEMGGAMTPTGKNVSYIKTE